jgi:leukotriene-A4 hydrolase
LKMAEEILVRAKPGYHPITTGSVEAAIAEGKAGKPATN